MRAAAIAVCMLLGISTPAVAEVSVGIGLPSVSIGINVGFYPNLVTVPGYPVYYAPQLDSNLFFYDGLYWVYAQDQWYASSWYNGPWDLMAPEMVPYFVLRVPVLYYRQPPAYFRGWGREEAPHWGEHWGRGWEQRRSDWNQWDRASVPPPAPLPTYQRQYSGDRYPRPEQQQAIRTQHYQYQPREAVVRQQFERPHGQPAAAPASAQNARGSRGAPSADTRPANAPPAANRNATADRSATADRAATTGRSESRPPPANQPAESRRQQADRPPAAQQQTQANSPRSQPAPSPDAQRRSGADSRGNAAPPAQSRQGNPAAEQQQARPAQAPVQRESQASHPPAQAERPPAKAPPPQEQKREPEREHDHQ
jgi:hypothetical protein